MKREGISIFFTLRDSNIYDIYKGDTKYYLRRASKNIFSAALPFYQSHVYMTYKHNKANTYKSRARFTG